MALPPEPPPPAEGSPIRIVPPCSSTVRLQTASPVPLPPPACTPNAVRALKHSEHLLAVLRPDADAVAVHHQLGQTFRTPVRKISSGRSEQNFRLSPSRFAISCRTCAGLALTSGRWPQLSLGHHREAFSALHAAADPYQIVMRKEG